MLRDCELQASEIQDMALALNLLADYCGSPRGTVRRLRAIAPRAMPAPLEASRLRMLASVLRRTACSLLADGGHLLLLPVSGQDPSDQDSVPRI